MSDATTTASQTDATTATQGQTDSGDQLLNQTIQETATNINRMAYHYEVVSNLLDIMPIALAFFAVGVLFSYFRWRVMTYALTIVGFFLIAVYAGTYLPIMRVCIGGIAVGVIGILVDLYRVFRKGFTKGQQPDEAVEERVAEAPAAEPAQEDAQVGENSSDQR